MEALNDILGASTAPEPPMRDIEGYVTVIRARRVPTMHRLTARGANDSETDETRLPAPEEPLLTRFDELQLAELIERHVDYTDANDRSVHLAVPFVKHYRQRDDDVLPVVTAVATLPMVLADGTILLGTRPGSRTAVLCSGCQTSCNDSCRGRMTARHRLSPRRCGS